MKTKIKEFRTKRCFFKRKDGSTGIMYHKSVELSEGSIIRFSKNEWKFSSTRMNSKVSGSLQLKSMNICEELGREEIVSEKFSNFKKFSERMVGIVGVDEFIKIVSFLK